MQKKKDIEHWLASESVKAEADNVKYWSSEKTLTAIKFLRQHALPFRGHCKESCL